MHHIAGFFASIPVKCRNVLMAPNTERGHWQGRFDFLLAAIGFAVGLGNLWGFPHLCYSNGGGAFLVAYCIMVLLIGLPITYMEMAFGQFTNLGPVHGWRGCPIMTGIGWAMVFVTGLVCIYYNVIIAWSIYYLCASFRSKLPWADCGNPWNDGLCLESGTDVHKYFAVGQTTCMDEETVNCTKYETSTVQYYERVALGFVSYDGVLRTMDDPLGSVQWHLALCLLLSWLLVFLCLMRGIQTSGRIVHGTATLPFILLLALLIRGVTLPGAMQGLTVFFTPKFSQLLISRVWSEASVQAFFSVGLGFGSYMTLASYNRINNNCYRDAIIVIIMDTLASVMSGVAVFSILGYMSHKSGLPVEKVVQSGPGLAFIAFTEAVSTMPAGPLWSTLIFTTLLTLGVDTQFLYMETVMTAILDQWPWLRSQFRLELAAKGSVCVAMFLLGLPICCQGGIYLVDVFSRFSASYNIYIIVLGEIAGVCLFYGLGNFIKDIKQMLGFQPGCLWIVCWTFVSPALLLIIVGFTLSTYTRPKVARGKPMADWGVAMGWSMMLLSLLVIVAFTFAWQPNVATASRQASQWFQDRLQVALGVQQRPSQVSAALASRPYNTTISARAGVPNYEDVDQNDDASVKSFT